MRCMDCNKCDVRTSICVKRKQQTTPRFLSKQLLDFCANQLYGFLEIVLKSAFHCVLNQLYKSAQLLHWNVCQAAVSFSSLSKNLPCSLALLLSIRSWKNEWPFASFSFFNLILSDFWVTSKSNGWNRLRSRSEIKCWFKSHFLFFNSRHFNKDPLSHLFPKSLFLSNFTLTLLKSLKIIL